MQMAARIIAVVTRDRDAINAPTSENARPLGSNCTNGKTKAGYAGPRRSTPIRESRKSKTPANNQLETIAAGTTLIHRKMLTQRRLGSDGLSWFMLVTLKSVLR